jgi:hypothetical protein
MRVCENRASGMLNTIKQEKLKSVTDNLESKTKSSKRKKVHGSNIETLCLFVLGHFETCR